MVGRDPRRGSKARPPVRRCRAGRTPAPYTLDVTDDVPAPAGATEETPTIRLDDVLKLAGIADTGGRAKRLIQAGEVKVNGAIETRRKRPLRAGDEVEVNGDSFVVELQEFEGDGDDDDER